MGLMDRKALLTKQELKMEKVILNDETGDFVYVRQMAGRERDQFEISQMKEITKEGKVVWENDMNDYRAKLAVFSVCDEKGNLIFKPGDIDALSQNTSFLILDRIAEASRKLNKIERGSKEEIMGNSVPGQDGASGSVSAGN